MQYTEEQRTLFRRLGAISARLDTMMAEDRAAQETMGRNFIDLGAALTAAIHRSNEIGALQREYGDVFREFLVDTL